MPRSRRWLYPTPADVSDRDAAAMALVGITAHLGLFRDAQLRRGETVFVHGGSGGVGSCVVQMAKAVGARVITTAGSDEKAEICRGSGPIWSSTTRPTTSMRRIRKFAPRASTSGSRRSASRTSSGPSGTWRCAGG